MIIFLLIVGIIVGLHVIGFIIECVKKGEVNKINPYGTLVPTKHGRMHLYEMGKSHEETVVVLPGLGNALPCADFGPLMRDLSVKYHVVCVDYLGLGFSDDTRLARNNENYVTELREALKNLGCEPPYILMPHSCSGVYCEYYAAKYPEEIKAMVMMDCTSTGTDVLPNAPGWMYYVGRFWQACGIMRLMNIMMPSMQPESLGYTKKEATDYRILSNHRMKPSFKSQNKLLPADIKEVSSMDYPQTIPTLKLQSEQAIKRFGEEYQNCHLKRLGENTEAYMIPGSTHMMHEGNHKEIAEKAGEFLDQVLTTGGK